MKLSPLQLEGYALLDLAYRANQEHKPGAPIEYIESDIVVATTCVRDPNDAYRWTPTLSLRFQPRPAANAPYYISLQLAGVLRVSPELEATDPELLIKVNSASLLFGVAREVVRQVTSVGPFPPLLIPSVTFRPDNAAATGSTPPVEVGNR
jgi:preprotein translocase subunit SecB